MNGNKLMEYEIYFPFIIKIKLLLLNGWKWQNGLLLWEDGGSIEQQSVCRPIVRKIAFQAIDSG